MPPAARTSVLAALALVVCDGQQSRNGYTATLYRNSAMDHSIRVHWASFDADESDRNYNLNNCSMAARLLNSNVRASAKAEQKEPDAMLGFWCEPGPYAEQGRVPMSFEAAFPTDTP